MVDSRLHSAHLRSDVVRRQCFRQARSGLLDARGPMTFASERGSQTVYGDHLHRSPPRKTTRGQPSLLDRQTGREYPLKVGLNTIGRFRNNDVVLEEPRDRISVSRRHCVVLVHATGGYELHDVASRNGTYVNGQRLTQPIWLESGDVIRVARRVLVFRCSAAGPRDPDTSVNGPSIA